MRFIPSQFSASFNIANTLRAKLLIKVNKPHMLSLLVHIKVNKLHLFSLLYLFLVFFILYLPKKASKAQDIQQLSRLRREKGMGEWARTQLNQLNTADTRVYFGWLISETLDVEWRSDTIMSWNVPFIYSFFPFLLLVFLPRAAWCL